MSCRAASTAPRAGDAWKMEEERIGGMIRLAVSEKPGSETALKYTKKEYVLSRLLRTFVLATVGFLAALLLLAAANAELIFSDAALLFSGKGMLLAGLAYVAVIAAELLFAWYLAAKEYDESEDSAEYVRYELDELRLFDEADERRKKKAAKAAAAEERAMKRKARAAERQGGEDGDELSDYIEVELSDDEAEEGSGAFEEGSEGGAQKDATAGAEGSKDRADAKGQAGKGNG